MGYGASAARNSAALDVRRAYLRNRWMACSYTAFVNLAVLVQENSAARSMARLRQPDICSGRLIAARNASIHAARSRTSSTMAPLQMRRLRAGHFTDGRIAGGNHHGPALHGFEHRQSEALIVRRIKTGTGPEYNRASLLRAVRPAKCKPGWGGISGKSARRRPARIRSIGYSRRSSRQRSSTNPTFFLGSRVPT